MVGRMRQEDIWDAEVARDYDRSDGGMFTAEVLGPTVDRLAGLAGSGRALEFAIGTGRVAVPLAARGVPVTGIELSQPMISQLREKADEAAIPVINGDMATSRAPGEYSLVYLVYNTIGNLLTQAEQVECFRNAARHLSPGGRFVIELGVPELRVLPPGQSAVVFESSPGYIGLDTYDVLNQHLTSHHFYFDERPGRPGWSAARTATSGPLSSTSWASWPVSSWRAGTRTGTAPSSRPSRRRTCRSTGSPRPDGRHPG